MIDYNLILYIGLALYCCFVILFILYEMNERKLDRELFKQQQLTESFEREKRND